MLRTVWRLTRGYHLRPWRSPYLRWRIETFSGCKEDEIGFREFWLFAWRERRGLWRFLRWVAEMDKTRKK